MAEKDDEKKICNIAALAMQAMLFEVSATPKPGLVDRNNSGAHQDMDFFTFMSSAAALHSCFDNLALTGFNHRRESLSALFPILREVGGREEGKMFALTKGINTHKGMIFSLGLLAGVGAWCIGKENSAHMLSVSIARMCQGLCTRELAGIAKDRPLTKGEMVYAKYGVCGARGEAESGFANVLFYILPIYLRLREENHDLNDSLVHCLLHIMATSVDTNIASRHDIESAYYARREARKVLDLGGFLTPEGKSATFSLDADFITRNISPGGCADLLAVTHFMYGYAEACR